MKRLAIITTHPIQYYAPVFELLTQRKNIEIKVFYTWGSDARQKYDPGFGKNINWDIPLLDGYNYEWVNNTSHQPGSHHFKGIINPDLIEQINNYRPDAVLVFGWAYDSHLKVLRHFKNKLPVYFRGDSTLLDQQSGFKALLRSVFLRWVYSYVNHAFYVGTNNKAYFKNYGLSENELSFAPHAVDNDRFAQNRADEVSQLKLSLGIHETDIVILFAAKLEEKKSPQLLLEVFLKLQVNNTHLLIVGDGILQSALKAKAAGNSNVHFLNFQNQTYMPVVYQACDLFCLPSKGPNETWGLAINEAMACGKAILASNKCGCAIDLVNENNGLIFNTNEPGALFKALKDLLTSKSKLAKQGSFSKQKIQAWNFTSFAQAIENKLSTQN